MKILIAVASLQWRHILHPKVIGEGADDMHGLFEGMFDFESQTIEADNLNGFQ